MKLFGPGKNVKPDGVKNDGVKSDGVKNDGGTASGGGAAPARLKTSAEDGRPLGKMPYIKAEIFDRGENGYLNYARYEVSGEGGRAVTVMVKSERDALRAGGEAGLSGELAARRRPHGLPSQEQLEYARDLGITLAPGLCGEDLSCMINRVVEDDDDSPSAGLALYADRRGAMFSAWIGQRAFYNLLFATLPARDKLEFFVYCVWCYLYSKPVGDLETSDAAAECRRFAETYESDKPVRDSLGRYDGSALIEFGRYSGKTRTAAFTAAVNFLRGYRIEQ